MIRLYFKTARAPVFLRTSSLWLPADPALKDPKDYRTNGGSENMACPKKYRKTKKKKKGERERERERER